MSGEVNENALSPTSITAVLLFRGKIGKGKYFLGLVAVMLTLFLAFVSFASAMMPTGGGGGEMLVLPLLLVVIYLHLAIVSARLRDAERSAWLAPIFVFGPLAWIALTVEFIETSGAWIFIALGFLIFYIMPGLMRRKDETAA
jgi:uncharacterized membrane protein YhaH (DUF805 family)